MAAVMPEVRVRFPDLSLREARAALGGAALAWAYMAAVRRGDLVRATTLLTSFQQFYNQHRRAASFGFENRAAAEEFLPQSLRIDGRFGPNTRTAMVGMYTSGLLIEPAEPDTMPEQAGAIGNWWWNTMVPMNPQDRPRPGVGEFLWDVNQTAMVSDPQDAAINVEGLIMPYVAGGPQNVPSTFASTGPATASNVLAQAMPSILQPQRQPPPEEVIELGAEVIRARPPFYKEPWFLWSALGALTLLGGALGYQIWRKQR